jgi:beta-lactamase class A
LDAILFLFVFSNPLTSRRRSIWSLNPGTAMKRCIQFSCACAFALIFLLSACRQEDKVSRLKKDIETELGRNKGTFAVAFYDLNSGEKILVNERETFHAASTMKTPVMIEVFKQANAGKFNLSDSLVVKNDFKSIVDGSSFSLDVGDDSEADTYKMIGKKRAIYDLVYDMIIMSSNMATNIVIELVDAKNVTSTMRELGANDIQVLRGVEDTKAFEKGMNNTTTAYDLMLIFEKIARNQMVNENASQKMISVLLDQKFNKVIPAQLPSDVKVAHKTGNITGVQHDSGIVILPNGNKYVLVLLSKNLEDEKEAIASMARVSKILYEYVVQ